MNLIMRFIACIFSMGVTVYIVCDCGSQNQSFGK